jgi:SnoaL-like domain
MQDDRTSTEQELRHLLDRQAILDCLNRYNRGVDRCDDELLLSAYHEDATECHGAFTGRPAEFARSIRPSQDSWACSQHHITNHIVEIEGELAHAETYFLVISRRNEEETVSFVGGRYLDRFERRHGNWRIALRVVVIDVGARADARQLPDYIARPRKDRDDPSYQRPLQPVAAINPTGKDRHGHPRQWACTSEL